MKRTYQENKSLYESIMRDVAKTVKRHLNEEHNTTMDTRVVAFGPSYTMGDLKSPAKQKEISDKLSSNIQSKAGFAYTGNKVRVQLTIENMRTDESKDIFVPYNTFYEAAIITSAISDAIKQVNLSNSKFFISVEPSDSFYTIRKRIMNRLNEIEIDAFDRIDEKMQNYLNDKLSDEITFENIVKEIANCINIVNKLRS